MKILKIIIISLITANLTFQIAQAGSLLTGTSGSTGSSLLTGNSGGSTGSSLLNSYENTDTSTDNIYDTSGSQMNCYTDSYGNTVCQ